MIYRQCSMVCGSQDDIMRRVQTGGWDKSLFSSAWLHYWRHCTALNWASLHCTKLHCTALNFIALHFTKLTALYYTKLQYTAISFTKLDLHWNGLQSPPSTKQHCIALQTTPEHNCSVAHRAWGSCAIVTLLSLIQAQKILDTGKAKKQSIGL